MKPSFDMTAEERAALAAHLRENSLFESIVTPEMEKALTEVSVREDTIPSRFGPSRVFFIDPKNAEAGRALYINFHGGGFVRGYGRRDTVFCAQISARLGCSVIDVDYRLAPEHPFPTAPQECYDIVAWAFENAERLGVDPARIAIGGHSAGGNLTAAISLMAQESGAFKVCGQVLDYPFLDGVTDPSEKVDPAGEMPVERMVAFNVLYGVTPDNLANPLLSPILADRDLLVGQAPALMLIAGKDCLRFEAQRYAARLIEAGVDIDVRTFAESDHGFTITAHDEWERAREVIFAWLGNALRHDD